jgi:hypothetical protein
LPPAPNIRAAVVDNSQNAESAAIGDLMRDKIETPALVWPQGNKHRRPSADRPFDPIGREHLVQQFESVQTPQAAAKAKANPILGGGVAGPLATAPATARLSSAEQKRWLDWRRCRKLRIAESRSGPIA